MVVLLTSLNLISGTQGKKFEKGCLRRIHIKTLHTFLINQNLYSSLWRLASTPKLVTENFTSYLKRTHSHICFHNSYIDNRCGRDVTSFTLIQRVRVRSPIGSISWLRFFRCFPSTVRQMSGNFFRYSCSSSESTPSPHIHFSVK